MRSSRVLSIGAIAAAVIGLGASVTALIDDLGGAPTFCAETGCEIVRTSVWARPLGIPMSVLGVGFYAACLALAFGLFAKPGAAAGKRAGITLRGWLAIAGAAWAAWLIGLQAFAIGAWCKLCLIADPAAIVHAACVLAGAATVKLAWRRVAVLVPAFGAVVIALAAWTSTPAPVIGAVATTPSTPATSTTPTPTPAVDDAGAVTIVEFVDFECPFCREMQHRLEVAIAQTSTPVRIVRKMVPLQIHAGALAAALAWCCADAQGKGEEMARALFEARPEDLTPEGCEQIAVRVGCDRARYLADLPQMGTRIAADVKDAQAAGVRALPTLIVGEHKITGAAASTAELVAMIDRTAQPR